MYFKDFQRKKYNFFTPSPFSVSTHYLSLLKQQQTVS